MALAAAITAKTASNSTVLTIPTPRAQFGGRLTVRGAGAAPFLYPSKTAVAVTATAVTSIATGTASVAEPDPEAAAKAHTSANTESTRVPLRRRPRVSAWHSPSATDKDADGGRGAAGGVDVIGGDYR